jgi:hypothetical protein
MVALAGAALYLLMLLTILINKEKISKLLIELIGTKDPQISFKKNH